MQRFRLVFFFLFLAFSVRFEKTRFAGKHRPNSTGTYQHDLCLPAYSSDASLLVGRLVVAIESLGRHSLWPYDDHHDQCSGHFTRLLLTSISNSRETAIRRFLYRVQGLSSLTLSLSLSLSLSRPSRRVTTLFESPNRRDFYLPSSNIRFFGSSRREVRDTRRGGRRGEGGKERVNKSHGCRRTKRRSFTFHPSSHSMVCVYVCVCRCVIFSREKRAHLDTPCPRTSWLISDVAVKPIDLIDASAASPRLPCRRHCCCVVTRSCCTRAHTVPPPEPFVRRCGSSSSWRKQQHSRRERTEKLSIRASFSELEETVTTEQQQRDAAGSETLAARWWSLAWSSRRAVRLDQEHRRGKHSSETSKTSTQEGQSKANRSTRWKFCWRHDGINNNRNTGENDRSDNIVVENGGPRRESAQKVDRAAATLRSASGATVVPS